MWTKTIKSIKMKKVFFVIMSICIFYTTAISQSADLGATQHNTILKKLLDEKDKGNLNNFSQVISLANSEATALGLVTQTTVLEQEFLIKTGFSNYNDFLNYLLNNNSLTNSEVIDMRNLVTSLKVLGETNGFRDFENVITQYQTNLNRTSQNFDKLNKFSVMLKSSLNFWLQNEVSDGGDVAARRCGCGFFCWLCVGVFDAAGFAAGGPLGSAIASFIARCCICSCCKGISQNSSYCTQTN